MNWTELKEKIYDWDHSYRDICILETSLDDNKKWLKYVNENYEIEWLSTKEDLQKGTIDFEKIIEIEKDNDDYLSTISVIIDSKIRINNHFFTGEEIENDIDPREVVSIEDHEKIIRYMKDLSFLLDKPVILTPENVHDIILIKVFKDEIEYNP